MKQVLEFILQIFMFLKKLLEIEKKLNKLKKIKIRLKSQKYEEAAKLRDKEKDFLTKST
jgi:protein-arginine kinase activator protein McsA